LGRHSDARQPLVATALTAALSQSRRHFILELLCLTPAVRAAVPRTRSRNAPAMAWRFVMPNTSESNASIQIIRELLSQAKKGINSAEQILAKADENANKHYRAAADRLVEAQEQNASHSGSRPASASQLLGLRLYVRIPTVRRCRFEGIAVAVPAQTGSLFSCSAWCGERYESLRYVLLLDDPAPFHDV
jgi:hypothetical protein